MGDVSRKIVAKKKLRQRLLRGTATSLKHEFHQTIGHFVKDPRNLNQTFILSWNSQGLCPFSTDRYFISRHQLFWADLADIGSLVQPRSKLFFYCENLEERQTF